MSLYRGMPSAEFIDYLRSWAINGNAQEVVIVLIDDLRLDQDAAAELEGVRAELEEAEEAIADLLDDHAASIEHLTAMCEMAMHASPADSGRDQSDIDAASHQIKLLKKQVKKYSETEAPE